MYTYIDRDERAESKSNNTGQYLFWVRLEIQIYHNLDKKLYNVFWIMFVIIIYISEEWSVVYMYIVLS
jgi:hypothetical protein